MGDPCSSLITVCTLSHSPRWLFEHQPWCLRSRQHNGGRKRRGEQKGEPQQSILLLWNLPIQHLPLISHLPEPGHIATPSRCLLPAPNEREKGRMVLLLCRACLANAQPVMTSPPTSASRLSPVLEKTIQSRWQGGLWTCGFQPHSWTRSCPSLLHASLQFFQVFNHFPETLFPPLFPALVLPPVLPLICTSCFSEAAPAPTRRLLCPGKGRPPLSLSPTVVPQLCAERTINRNKQ